MARLIKIKRGELDRAFSRYYRLCRNGLRNEEKNLLGPVGETIGGTFFQGDLSFLVMLFSSVYKFSNITPEKKRRSMLVNKSTIYAANMDVILTYIILRYRYPNRWRVFNKRAYKVSALYYPQKVSKMEELFALLEDKKDEMCRDQEEMAGIVGRIFSEIFSWREDKNTKLFSDFGYQLGKYFYITKVYKQLKNDEKKGTYNPLIFVKRSDPESFDIYIRQEIKSQSKACIEAFNKLPIRENSAILTHALNAGVLNKNED